MRGGREERVGRKGKMEGKLEKGWKRRMGRRKRTRIGRWGRWTAALWSAKCSVHVCSLNR